MLTLMGLAHRSASLKRTALGREGALGALPTGTKTLTPEQAIASLGVTREQVCKSLKSYIGDGVSYYDIHNCLICRYMRSLGFEVTTAGGFWVGVNGSRVHFNQEVAFGILDACKL